MDNLYIPKKLNIGFQNRSDTYTGKLAYIVYYDDKNVLRKEKSWQSWRDKNITNIEVDNIPTEGFVLNKKVGDYKSDWNHRKAHIRVYDPRNFEFEISVENLLFILSNNDCIRGKGLTGKFVYAWDRTDLVLLPTDTVDYESSQFTKLQAKTSIKPKDLKLGCAYITKQNQKWIYLGKFPIYNYYINGAKYIFINSDGSYQFLTDTKKIVSLVDDQCVSNYSDLVDDYQKSIYGSQIVSLCLKDKIDSNDYYLNYFADKSDDVFNIYKKDYNEFRLHYIVSLKDNQIISNGKYKRVSINDTGKIICAKLESGSLYTVSSYGQIHKKYEGE